MFPGVIKAKFFNNVTVLEKKPPIVFFTTTLNYFWLVGHIVSHLGQIWVFPVPPTSIPRSEIEMIKVTTAAQCKKKSFIVLRTGNGQDWNFWRKLESSKLFTKDHCDALMWWLHDSLLWYHSISSCYISWPLSVTNWNNKGFMGQTAKKTFQLEECLSSKFNPP